MNHPIKDPLGPARGVIIATIISVFIWIVIIFLAKGVYSNTTGMIYDPSWSLQKYIHRDEKSFYILILNEKEFNKLNGIMEYNKDILKLLEMIVNDLENIKTKLDGY